MLLYVFMLLSGVLLCFAQRNVQNGLQNMVQNIDPNNLHELSESIGNFSVELLYHATALQGEQNLILSPITTWTVLAVTAEGALMNTRKQLNRALRIPANETLSRPMLQEISQWSLVNTSTVQLAKFNGIFIDKNKSLETNFQQVAKMFYDTQILETDFRDAVKTADYINQDISSLTKGRIPKLVEASDFGEAEMIIASAAYFKGQWTWLFNASSTTKQLFYDSNGTSKGEVNMMFNRYTYPFIKNEEIQARILELPYGKENRLSMLIMLPNRDVTVQDMFLNLKKVSLDTVLAELKLSLEEYEDEEIDCFIPKFKIESNLDFTEILKKAMFIEDLFNPHRANLDRLARHPMYVTKVIHKAEIEVTEEGITPSPVKPNLFSERIPVLKFKANRPFTYLIVDKVTNAILFGGVYQQPSLY